MHIEVDIGEGVLLVHDEVLHIADVALSVLVYSVRNPSDNILLKFLWSDSPHDGSIQLSCREVLFKGRLVIGVGITSEKLCEGVHDELQLL